MITIFYHKKRRFKLPEHFEELSPKQFIRLASLLFSGGDELKCQVQALRILSGINAFRFAFLSAETISRCLPYVEWVFKERNITKQLIPTYKGYYGPASGFDNLKMKEFHFTEHHYQELIENESDDALNNLIAVIYRKAKRGYDKRRDQDGDIRVEFNHNEISYYAKKIDRWPAAVKQAIFLWYDGCRQEVIENNPLVFKAHAKHSFKSQFDIGLYGMIRNLAGEKLGPVDKIENMYVLTAMLEIGLLKEEEKFFEEQLKSQRQQ